MRVEAGFHGVEAVSDAVVGCMLRFARKTIVRDNEFGAVFPVSFRRR
jgi:hypothetical protein